MTEIILITVIIFLSSFVRSIFGFADALIAMPLLLMVTDLGLAAPLVALFSSVIAIGIIIKDIKSIKAIFDLPMLSVIILCIPLGTFFATIISEILINITLGLTLIVFALFKLFYKKTLKIKITNISKYIIAVLSGILGGAYNVNGPPIVIYGTISEWQPQEFRSRLQGFFLPTNLVICVTHYANGLWTERLFTNFSICLPFVGFAFLIGTYLNKRIKVETFNVTVYYLLLILGIYLTINSLS